jgi:DNA-binding MarR family transcriptional regulator
MHPATLGQAIDGLRLKGHCVVRRDDADKRARQVAITAQGLALAREAPLAGPDRLRQVDHEVKRLDALAAALGDAVALFGLGRWETGQKPERR